MSRVLKVKKHAVRYRNRYVPAFSQDPTQPQIKHAQLDKTTLLIEDAYTVRLNDVYEFNAFKSALGHTPLFTQGHRNKSHIFTIKGTETRPRWLLGGKAILKIAPGLHGETLCKITLELDLNPTRFINHVIANAGGVDAITTPEHFLTMVSRVAPEDLLEADAYATDIAIGLDENSNLIPAKALLKLPHISKMLPLYLEKCLALILWQISAAARPRSVAASSTNWAITHCEVYWEYAVSDAISFVYDLAEIAAPQFKDSSVREYRLRHDIAESALNPRSTRKPSRAIKRNSPGLTLQPAAGNIQYVIYAKEPNRVRFEVRYRGTLKRILQLRTGNAVRSNKASTLRLINGAIENAQKRIQKLFNALPDLAYIEHTDLEGLVEFMAAVGSACRSTEAQGQVKKVIALLAANKGVEAKLDTKLYSICTALAQEGVLVHAKANRNTKGYRKFALNIRFAHTLTAIIDTLAAAADSTQEDSA